MLPDGLQYPQSPKPITLEKVLLVEGMDAFQFFKALLHHLNLLSEIEIRNFGGINQLDFLETLMITDGFDRLNSLGIVRDAESNANSAFQSVSDLLSRIGLSVPQQPMAIAQGNPVVSVFILPDCVNSGMLETLLYQAIGDDPATSCIEEHFQCLVEKGVALPTNMDKARVHTFLSSKSPPGLLIGQAAHKDFWPWENSTFDGLKEFLKQI